MGSHATAMYNYVERTCTGCQEWQLPRVHFMTVVHMSATAWSDMLCLSACSCGGSQAAATSVPGNTLVQPNSIQKDQRQRRSQINRLYEPFKSCGLTAWARLPSFSSLSDQLRPPFHAHQKRRPCRHSVRMLHTPFSQISHDCCCSGP